MCLSKEIDPLSARLEILQDYDHDDVALLYKIPDPLRSLRFVSCGRPENSGLAFPELVKIFDQWIWLWLFLSILSISLMLEANKLGSTKNLVAYFRSCITKLFPQVKALLEQGDDNLTSFRC